VHCSRYDPILLKTAEAVRIYNLKMCRGNQTHAIDREVELKNWQHPPDEAKTLEADEHRDKLIQVYTDGSKNRQGVGSGVALYIGTDLALQENSSWTTDAQTTRLSSWQSPRL